MFEERRIGRIEGHLNHRVLLV